MRTLIVLSLFVPFAHLSAQNLSGFIRDTTGHAIAFSSVVITGYHDDQIIAYATADEQGHYRLGMRATCDSVILTVRALGYKTNAIIHALRNLPATLDLALEEMVLQEVIIHGKTPPVIVRGDTTEYHVASFSDSTEFSVEELLKKLPGAQVSENGRISLNGKDVDRVLIEGDDLFNQNYQIATRNIRADMISKVQAIDRFQENPLMKGIQESERLVLNLKIKDERKRALSGSVTAGLGYGNEWKNFAHTNLFSLSRRNKTYLIGNENNVGYNSLGDVQGAAGNNLFDRNQQHLQSNPLPAELLVQSPRLETGGLPPAFSRTNKTSLLCLGQVIPVSPNFKIKISGWVGREQLRQQVEYSSRYVFGAGGFDLNERRNTFLSTGLRNLQIETDYFFKNKKQSLRSFIQVNDKPELSEFEILRSTNRNAETVLQNQSGNTFQSLVTVEYTLKMDKNAALQFTLKDAALRANHTLSPEYAFYHLFFELDSSFTRLQQTTRQQQHLSTISARCLKPFRSFHFIFETGIQQQWNTFRSAVNLESKESGMRDAGSQFTNDFDFEQTQVYTQASVSREYGPWYFSGGSTVFLHSILQQNTGVSTRTKPPLLAERYGNIRYTFNSRSFVLLNYRYQPRLPRFTDYIPGYVFTGYQTARSGLPVVAVMPGHSAGFKWYYTNRPRQYGWNIGITMGKRGNQPGTEYDISPYLFLQQLFRPVQSSHYSIIGSAHRYFPALASRFEIGFDWLNWQQQNKINSDMLRNLNTHAYSAHLEYGSAFNGWVNLILSGHYNYSVAKNRLEGLTTELNATSWQTSAQVVLKPAKKWSAKCYFYQFANRTSSQMPYNVSYATQLEALWQLPKLHSSLHVSGLNLLNNKNFQQVSADAFSQNTTILQAVSPFFLVKWDYGF